jgi:hypothetical protein
MRSQFGDVPLAQSRSIALVLLIAVTTLRPLGAADQAVLWADGNARAKLIVPPLAGPAAQIVEDTLNGYCQELFGWKLPLADQLDAADTLILAGNVKTNPIIAKLASAGLAADTEGLEEEGFRLVSHVAGPRKLILILGNTPAALKFGCQELVFFQLTATPKLATVDLPLDLTRRPHFAYRGIYMLPCWAQHDTVESWRRVLRFNSEITINRNWFWLDGFPLLEKYGGEYAGTDLAKVENVRLLITLCRREAMKFYVGGGWFTWHHEKAAQGSYERGVQYYRDLVALLADAEGLYLELIGEEPADGGRTAEVAARHATALAELAGPLLAKRSDFELAVAIGRQNGPEFRKAVHAIDRQRLWWWWCWGDPIRDGATSEHPLVLRWHTSRKMSDLHGSTEPPQPRESPLAGFATSYDPGMGFGNPWNGRGEGIGTGIQRARNFHPHTLPYFAHQYHFRERAWNPHLSDEQFRTRLARRLFDADQPAEAIDGYLRLCQLCRAPQATNDGELQGLTAFVARHERQGTPRNRDTLYRMREAVEGLRQLRGAASKR